MSFHNQITFLMFQTTTTPPSPAQLYAMPFDSSLETNHSMAHLLTPPAPTTAPTPLPAKTRKISLNSWKNNATRVCCIGHQHQHHVSSISDHDHQLPPSSIDHSLRRRALMMGLSGVVVLGLSLSDDEQRASGAARRPPPPPPQEKKDPNLSGVQAKVLASKKRKEAMKEEIARLRERGKPVNNAPPPPPTPEPEAAPE